MRRFWRWTARAAVVLLGAIVVAIGLVELLSRRSYSDVALPLIRASGEPAQVTRGEYLVNSVAHCPSYHLPNAEARRFHALARPDLRGGQRWQLPFGTVVSANITPSRDHGIGAWSDGELARVLRTGVRRDGTLSVFMKVGVGAIADDDIAAIIAYLRAQPAVDVPVPPSRYNFLGRAVAAFAVRPRTVQAAFVAPRMEATVERGGYLVLGPANCAGCHSPSGIGSGFLATTPLLSGGPADAGRHRPRHGDRRPKPHAGRAHRRHLHVVGGSVRRTLSRRPRGGGLSHAVEAFATMSDTDLAAIWRYLRTVPAVEHDVGPTHRPLGSYPPAP